MEVSAPQLAQAVAAARVALTEALVLKVGQLLQATVVGKGSDGLTMLKIGDQVVKAALPEGFAAGATLQLQVKVGGPTPQLAIVGQSALQAPVGVVPVRAPLPLLPVASAEARIVGAVAGANIESSPTVAPLISHGESTPAVPPAVAGARAQTAETRIAVRLPDDAVQPLQQLLAGRAVTADASAVPRTASAPLPGATNVAPQPVQPAVQTTIPAAAQSAVSPAQPVAAALATELAIPTGGVVTFLPPTGQPMSDGAPSPQAAEPRAPAPLPSLQAPVASVLPPSEPEVVNPLLLAQAAPRPQATMADLPRPAMSPGVPSSQPPAPLPQTPQAALAQMLPEALARQDSAGPLLTSLAALLQKAAMLPEPIIRAALGVLAQRIVVPDGRVGASELERAVARSGIGLEAALAKGEAQPGDGKAGLLALRAALVKFLGETPAPMVNRDAASPPLKGLPLRTPTNDPVPLPDGPRDLARALHSQTDAAVSRVKLMQLASLPDADAVRPSAPSLRLELPFLIGHELVMAQIQIARDGSRREAERRRGWTMRLALNFSATGEVGAEVGLLGKAVNVALWAAEPETAVALNAALPELSGALEAIGLKPGSLRIRQGVPEPAKPVSGRLLDSVS